MTQPNRSRQADRSQLRRDMRRQRNALTSTARNHAAQAIAQRLRRQQLFVPGARIAIYQAIDGEVDLTPVWRLALQRRCRVYTPHIVSMHDRTMEFMAVGSPHRRFNATNSASPSRLRTAVRSSTVVDPRLLDVVLVPMVAFDVHGWRLGFGAGFYDRKLAFKRNRMARRPLCIGIGYEFQRVATQMPSPWDVPMDAIATEVRFYRCRHA